MQFGSPNRVIRKRARSALTAWARSMRRAGSRQLVRRAIASRVNIFKRSTNCFGIQAGLTGTSTHRLVNAGGTNQELIKIANVGASEFLGNTCYQFGGSLQFMLGHVANSSEITNLYDNYRIKMVYVKITPSFNSADVYQAGSDATHISIPTMHYAVDTDDSVVPGTRNTVMENSYSKTVRLDKPFTIAVKPRAQNVVALSNGTNVAGGLMPSNVWLDSSSIDILHYGLKFWIDEWPTVTAANTPGPFIKFDCTYILEAKNVV